MIKDWTFKAVAVLVVVALNTLPAAGAVCAMACSDDPAGCCCRSSSGGGAVSLTSESCCSPELSARNPGIIILPEAVPAKVRPVPLTAFVAGHVAAGRVTAPAGELRRSAPDDGPPGRSSPLFVLHSSFLI